MIVRQEIVSGGTLNHDLINTEGLFKKAGNIQLFPAFEYKHEPKCNKGRIDDQDSGIVVNTFGELKMMEMQDGTCHSASQAFKIEYELGGANAEVIL